MREISTTAWVIIILLGVLILLFNLALLASFLGRKRPDRSAPPPPSQRIPYDDLKETIRHPWQREDRMLDELSQRVSGMKKPGEDQEPGAKE